MEINEKDLQDAYKIQGTVIGELPTEERINYITEMINTGNFRYLTFTDCLGIDDQITRLIEERDNKMNLYSVAGRFPDSKYKEIEGYDKLLTLDANQVYMFLKDGLKFDRFLNDPKHEEAFNNLHGETTYSNGNLHKAFFVVDRAELYAYFLGEELMYLLETKANEGYIRRFTQDWELSTQGYFRGSYQTQVKSMLDFNFHNTEMIDVRRIMERDIFNEFENGAIRDTGQVNLDELRDLTESSEWLATTNNKILTIFKRLASKK